MYIYIITNPSDGWDNVCGVYLNESDAIKCAAENEGIPEEDYDEEDSKYIIHRKELRYAYYSEGKYIENPVFPKIVDAVQWIEGKEVEGVVTNDPFIQTGSYMDRFNDRTDVYVIINGIKQNVRSGDWIVTSDGIKKVISNDSFIKLYNKL